MQLKDVTIDAKFGGFGIGTTWSLNERERLAAWEILLQLGTRTTIAPLPDGQGSLVAALASLKDFFDLTRDILKEHGPDVARDKGKGNPSLATIAAMVLNDHLRPVLTKWHPELDDWMSTRPTDKGVTTWERAWDPEKIADLRAELTELRETLRRYLELLGQAAGTEAFARALTPD